MLAACGSAPATNGGSVTVRLGYFPNLTQAVALVGVARGTFQAALGSNVTLETRSFTAGPALIEALFANEVDIGYVGPNPAINGYVKSQGAALRIIAGASSGGALFISPARKTPGFSRGDIRAVPYWSGAQGYCLTLYSACAIL